MSEEMNVKPTEYVEVDKNMIVETNIGEPDITFHDIRKPPFQVYGFYDYRNEPYFRRLPAEVAEATSPAVVRLSRESVGGRVRFFTDSSYVAISVEYVVLGRGGSHTPFAAAAGFDIYEDYPGDICRSRFCNEMLPPYKTETAYEQIYRFGSRAGRYITINFPLHSCVKNLYIGLQADAKLGQGLPYRNRRPVVVYGSSIVHGTGATRPGLAYSNMLTRRLNLDITNLGFSGNAKAEKAMVDYLADMDMSIFICDYDHNSPNAEHLRATHMPMYDAFREKKPDTPYIMISRPNVATYQNALAPGRRDVIIDTYRHARALGDKKVYYIDGETFFLGKNENDCTIDTVHPNDLGYSLMADGIESVLRSILEDGEYLN